jgi:hypothetical protein
MRRYIRCTQQLLPRHHMRFTTCEHPALIAKPTAMHSRITRQWNCTDPSGSRKRRLLGPCFGPQVKLKPRGMPSWQQRGSRMTKGRSADKRPSFPAP